MADGNPTRQPGEPRQPSDGTHSWSGNLEAVFEMIAEPVLVYDPDGTLVLMNAAALGLLGPKGIAPGASVEEVLEKGGLRGSDDRPLSTATAAAARALLGERVEGVEEALPQPGGGTRSFLVSGTPLGADHQPQGAVVLMRDITDRKLVEAEIRGINEELRHQLRERTAQAAQFQRANEELESFSYSISHDLRAPLRAINGFASVLLEELAPTLAPDTRQYLLRVVDNARLMNRLIDDLLAFSRLSRSPLNKVPVDMDELVRQVLEALCDEQIGRRTEIVVEPLPTCQADPALLRQVLLNLLGNALKFTRKKEVARIEVGSRREGDEVVYFVRDNGVGFDMGSAGRLFGVFQRLHRDSEYEGTGVGLAIVKRIVVRHGGRVWAEAEPGRGAAFSFTMGGGAREGALLQPSDEAQDESPSS